MNCAARIRSKFVLSYQVRQAVEASKQLHERETKGAKPMTRVRGQRAFQTPGHMIMSLVVCTIMTLIGANELAAQRPASTTPSFPDGIEAPDFSGTWRIAPAPRGRGFVEAEACKEL